MEANKEVHIVPSGVQCYHGSLNTCIVLERNFESFSRGTNFIYPKDPLWNPVTLYIISAQNGVGMRINFLFTNLSCIGIMIVLYHNHSQLPT